MRWACRAASDPGITRHLAAFLKRQLGKAGLPVAPRALLFNGGVFTPESLLQVRVVDALRQVVRSARPSLAAARC